jgi:hypothetical protein
MSSGKERWIALFYRMKKTSLPRNSASRPRAFRGRSWRFSVLESQSRTKDSLFSIARTLPRNAARSLIDGPEDEMHVQNDLGA